MFGPDKCSANGKIHLIFRYKNPKNGTVDVSAHWKCKHWCAFHSVYWILFKEYHAKQPSNIGSSYWDDHQTHLYTLVVKPDGAFSVSVDEKQIMTGNMLTVRSTISATNYFFRKALLQDLVPSLQPPKEIADPTDTKPDDWDDR